MIGSKEAEPPRPEAAAEAQRAAAFDHAALYIAGSP
jgi:hypothetical protein